MNKISTSDKLPKISKPKKLNKEKILKLASKVRKILESEKVSKADEDGYISPPRSAFCY